MKTFWPEELNYFENRELIGAGQYGLVYKVYNEQLQKTSVVKLVEVLRVTHADLLKRFEREIKGLKKVNHHRVVSIFDYWVSEQFVAFEMEYVPGISLETFLKRTKDFSYSVKADIVLEIIRQILDGLVGIHANFLIHRDLKPSNILLKCENIDQNMSSEDMLKILEQFKFEIKLTDFGVVKDLTSSISITRTSDFIGTAAYVSPEQAKGEQITFQSDLYALGLIWYELVSGINPFQRKNIYETIRAHVQETAPNIEQDISDFPPDFAHIINTLLKKEGQSRFYTAERLSQTLKRKSLTNIPVAQFDISENLMQTPQELGLAGAVSPLLNDIRESSGNLSVNFLPLSANIYRFGFMQQSYKIDNPEKLVIRFLYSESPDLVVSLSRQIFDQIPQTARERTQKAIGSNSIQQNIFSLINESDFYKRLDIVQANLQPVPKIILMYNWINLLEIALKFTAEQFLNIYLIMDGLDTQLDHYRYFLLPFINQFSKQNFTVIITISQYNQAEKLISGLDEQYTHQIDTTSLPEINSTDDNWYSEIFRKNGVSASVKNHPNISELSKDELHFLQYLAMFGFSTSSEYLNWVINSKFGARGDFVLNLFKKKILRHLPLYFTISEIAFADVTFYQAVLHTIEPSHKLQIYNNIRGFLQNSPDIFERFIISPNWSTESLAPLIAHFDALLVYYFEINDYVRRDELFRLIKLVMNQEKIPNDLRFKLNIALYLPFYGQNEPASYSKLWDMYKDVPGKYKTEKKYLLSLLYYLALNENNLPKMEVLKKEKEIHLKEPDFLYFESELIRISGLILKVQYLKASKELSQLLILANEINLYWYLPTTSCLLAKVYLKLKEWESAYQYSALAFQAGRAINDYWILDKCIELMEMNEYYKNNESAIFNWHKTRNELIHTSADFFRTIDFRENLFRIIH